MYGWNEEMVRVVQQTHHRLSPISARCTMPPYNPLGEGSLRARHHITRNSLIAGNLYIAAPDPLCMVGILDKIFNEIANLFIGTKVTNQSDENKRDDVSIYNIACALGP